MMDELEQYDESSVSLFYNDMGYVHRVCSKGHYWKDQEFRSVNERCPKCRGLNEKTSYHEPHNSPVDNYSPPAWWGDDQDDGNYILES